MGRKRRIDRENLELVRNILGSALLDCYLEDALDDIREALKALALLPGGAHAAPPRLRRMTRYWYGKRPRTLGQHLRIIRHEARA